MFQCMCVVLFLFVYVVVEYYVCVVVLVVFNLEGYIVFQVFDWLLGGRCVVVAVDVVEGVCLGCGVFLGWVYQWVCQFVKDIFVGGDLLELVVVKFRFLCVEGVCLCWIFMQIMDQLLVWVWCIIWLWEVVVVVVLDFGWVIVEVVNVYGLVWGIVNVVILGYIMVLLEVDKVLVWVLGIDEYWFVIVKWFKYFDMVVWCWVELWMSIFVVVDIGYVFGVVDGWFFCNVIVWLVECFEVWLDWFEVVVIDFLVMFCIVICKVLLIVDISVDYFYLVKFGNQMFIEVC